MKSILILIAALSLPAQVAGQEKKVLASYWVAETNINQKNFTIIRLYDNNNKLVHEVRMDGIYFDVNVPRHQKMLNQLLRGYYDRAETTARKIRRDQSRAL